MVGRGSEGREKMRVREGVGEREREGGVERVRESEGKRVGGATTCAAILTAPSVSIQSGVVLLDRRGGALAACAGRRKAGAGGGGGTLVSMP